MKFILSAIFFCIILSSCQLCPLSPGQESAGVDSRSIENIVKTAERKNLELHNLLVIHKGNVAADYGTSLYQSNELHDIASVTKSVIALLTGIAIEQGLINLDSSINESMPHNSEFQKNSAFNTITIYNLLSMKSGLPLNSVDPQYDDFAEPSLLEMMMSENWGSYLSSLTLSETPGNNFSYNSLNYHILSRILSSASGMSTEMFADTYLFNPLGISDYSWESDPEGYNYGWGNLKLTSLDLGKIGMLILNKGKSDGINLVSEEWIDQMLSVHSKDSNNPFFRMDYGLGWFISQGWISGFSAALGRGGQCLYLFPEKEMLVITMGNYSIPSLIWPIFQIKTSESESFSKSNSYQRNISLRSYESSNRTETYLPVGTWLAKKNPYGLESISLFEEKEGEQKIVLKSRLFSSEGVYSPVNSRSFHSVRIIPISAEGRHFKMVVSEIENINTFTLDLKFTSEKNMTLGLSEPVLFPKNVNFELIKRGR